MEILCPWGKEDDLNWHAMRQDRFRGSGVTSLDNATSHLSNHSWLHFVVRNSAEDESWPLITDEGGERSMAMNSIALVIAHLKVGTIHFIH